MNVGFQQLIALTNATTEPQLGFCSHPPQSSQSVKCEMWTFSLFKSFGWCHLLWMNFCLTSRYPGAPSHSSLWILITRVPNLFKEKSFVIFNNYHAQWTQIHNSKKVKLQKGFNKTKTVQHTRGQAIKGKCTKSVSQTHHRNSHVL